MVSVTDTYRGQNVSFSKPATAGDFVLWQTSTIAFLISFSDALADSNHCRGKCCIHASYMALTFGPFEAFLPRTPLQLLPKRCCGENILAVSLAARFLRDLHACKAELMSSTGIQRPVSFVISERLRRLLVCLEGVLAVQ